MTEYEIEPTPGLPGALPAGETIVWQGSPDWRTLARTAFGTRLVAGYFALLVAWAVVARGFGTAAMMTLGCGVIALVLLHALAWASAKTTIYTLTERRIVLRIGIAVPKCVNLPLARVASVDLGERHGDVALAMAGRTGLGILALWPHVRPWRIAAPQPTLRALPDARAVAARIAQGCTAIQPGPAASVSGGAAPQPAPAFAQAIAA